VSQQRALVIGGNRFFGRHLTLSLLDSGYDVTLLNRGRYDDDLGNRIRRIKADRTKSDELKAALGQGQKWDLVFDQVCFNANEARTICKLLEGRAGRVLFTSSQSVYGYGVSIQESAFDPFHHEFSKEVTADEDYAEAKRQAETVFAKFPRLLPVMVRMPLVVGPDDYTGRFSWHIERCEKGLPIYFPNEKARLGFIRSDMAGRALLKIAESNFLGSVNCACPGDIELREFMRLIEEKTGKAYVRANEPNDENHSPYGVEQNWTMNMEKMGAAGISLPELSNWLPDLIASYSS